MALAVPIFIIVVVAIVALAVVVPLYVWLGRRRRGSLRLDIRATTYQPGDFIDGVVHLEAKTELGPGSVVVSLVCTEEWWEWETDANGHQTRHKRTREVYRQDVEVATDLSVLAGEQRPIPFTIPTPPPTIPDDREQSFALRLMKSMREIVRADRDQLWDVEARYDIPGLDLVGEQRISFYDPR